MGRFLIFTMSLLTIFQEFLIFFIFIIFIYNDLKFRKIPNRILKYGIIIGILINYIEFINNSKLLVLLLIKIYFIIVIFGFSLLLYLCNIVGGGDGKGIILIFSIKSVSTLNNSIIILFFLYFTFFYISYNFINFLINHSSNSKEIFNQFYLLYSITTKRKKILYKSAYIFYPLSDLNYLKKCNYIIKTTSIIYDYNRYKLMILIQFRFPIFLFFLFSYYLLYIIA